MPCTYRSIERGNLYEDSIHWVLGVINTLYTWSIYRLIEVLTCYNYKSLYTSIQYILTCTHTLEVTLWGDWQEWYKETINMGRRTSQVINALSEARSKRAFLSWTIRRASNATGIYHPDKTQHDGSVIGNVWWFFNCLALNVRSVYRDIVSVTELVQQHRAGT